jgi:hypothetical protein
LQQRLIQQHIVAGDDGVRGFQPFANGGHRRRDFLHRHVIGSFQNVQAFVGQVGRDQDRKLAQG